MSQTQQQTNSKKMVERNVPSQLRVSVVHLHSGNSSRNKRKGHKYLTIARLLDRSTDAIISEGRAYCSDGDAPRRSIGRHVAVGRALSFFHKDMVDARNITAAAQAYLTTIPAAQVKLAIGSRKTTEEKTPALEKSA